MPGIPFTIQRRVARFRDRRCAAGRCRPVAWSGVRPAVPALLQRADEPGSPRPGDGIADADPSLGQYDARVHPPGPALRGAGGFCLVAGTRGYCWGDSPFSASVMYGAAQWPLFEHTDVNLTLERKKTDCQLEFIKYADHRVEPMETRRWLATSTCRQPLGRQAALPDDVRHGHVQGSADQCLGRPVLASRLCLPDSGWARSGHVAVTRDLLRTGSV